MQRTNVRVSFFGHPVEDFEGLVHGCSVARVVRECDVDHDEDYGGGEGVLAVHVAVCCCQGRKISGIVHKW